VRDRRIQGNVSNVPVKGARTRMMRLSFGGLRSEAGLGWKGAGPIVVSVSCEANKRKNKEQVGTYSTWE
jgi:hypothetical protein